MNFEAKATVVIVTVWLLLFGYCLAGLRDEEKLSKTPLYFRIGEKFFALIGVIMTALDNALARFTAFARGVLDQLKGAKEANDTQTGKLAELQAALDTALADDAADKATIAALQAEVSTLQDEVAAKINAAVDALENPPVVEEPVVEEPVVEEPVVEEVPVVEDTTVVVDENGSTPVE